MTIRLHRNFERRYKRLRKSEQRRVKERLALFLSDEFHPVLNNHPLKGMYKGYRSINIAGDLRAVYKFQNPDIRIFVTVDTHANLYKS
ncbi:MAG: type II toxin-antitoxin system mRNA interferase toxin, RelE/StbE family [Candidatus Portnoybacteria bacterium]|nr:type II toxin-antitoxin system mRNA interferase toxin, RelE/StbE family [Candidatus Portnoybacteria bacterium]